MGTSPITLNPEEEDYGCPIGDTAPTSRPRQRGPDQLPRLDRGFLGGSLLHPRDFTPVCTTELGYMAKHQAGVRQAERQDHRPFGRPLGNHEKWAKDIEETQGTAPNYPIIGDPDFEVSKLYGMLPASVSGDPTKRTPADNQTVRNVFVIGPDKKVKLILVYPMTTGRTSTRCYG